MNRVIRRSLAAALSLPAALLPSVASPASAATVLVAEGTAQLRGTVQTAFGGEFCKKNTCRSVDNARGPFGVALGSHQIQAAVQATPGAVMVVGYSVGAASVYDRMRMWEQNPASAPDPERVVLIVTLGNPERKYGGTDRNNSYAGLPDVQPYAHLDVTMQYDSVSDRPTRMGWYSSVNMSFAQHLAYFEPVDINDPDNLIYRDADGTTYMLIKADVLPMLKWMDPWLSDQKMAELDATYRPLVEADYDRPAYLPQGDGADWGNGNPPPTAQVVSDDPDDGDVADTPRRQKSGTEDEPDADDPSVDLPVETPGADGLAAEAAEPETDAENGDGQVDDGQVDDDETVAATDSTGQTPASDAPDDGS